MMAAHTNPPRSRGGGGEADGGGVKPAPTVKKQALRKRSVDEARSLRRNMTLPEVLLWNELKASGLGVPFRKQHPIGPYKADFCCTENMLVVEVDGMAHDLGTAPQRDSERDAYMMMKGFAVLRVPARDVLGRMAFVLEGIRAALPPLHRASAVPLPVNGEDF